MRKILKGFAVCLPVVGAASGYYMLKPLECREPDSHPYQLLPKASYSDHPNKHYLTKVPESVGVVGGGISGAIVAKTLSQQGYKVEVIERNPGAGGIWYQNYDGSGLQFPYPHYNLPDHEFPEDTELIPKRESVKQFIEDYMTKFNLWPMFKFSTEVSKIHQRKDGTWEVSTKSGQKKQYDFLVVTNGPYNKPYIPEIEGLSSFKGKFFHSSEFINIKEHCEGKKVVVVGSGKSAMDVVTQAYKNGAECTLVMRKAHWLVPPGKTFLGLPLFYFNSNRFAGLLMHPYYNTSGAIFQYMQPLVKGYWKVIEWVLNQDMPQEMIPSSEYHREKLYRGGARNPEVPELVKQGNMKLVRGQTSKVKPEGLEVNGETLEADVIVFATGFSRDFLGLSAEEDGIWMYRNTIIPGKKNFAIVGLINTYCNPLYTNIQALWLSEVLRGRVRLPSEGYMQDDVFDRKKYTRQIIDESTASFSWFPYPMIDQFLSDIGVETNRKPSLFKFWFEPIKPSDYTSVVTHRV